MRSQAGARLRPRVISLESGIGIDEVGLADFPQDGGEEDVGDGEIVAGDPFTAVQPPLQPAEPAASLPDQLRPPVFGTLAIAERSKSVV